MHTKFKNSIILFTFLTIAAYKNDGFNRIRTRNGRWLPLATLSNSCISMQILLQTTCKKLKGTARPTKNEQVKRMYGLSTWEIAMHNRFKSILKANSYFFSSVTSQDICETHIWNDTFDNKIPKALWKWSLKWISLVFILFNSRFTKTELCKFDYK